MHSVMTRGRWIGVLMIALAAASGIVWLLLTKFAADPTRTLVGAAALARYRTIAPRLTGGFAWAPFRGLRGASDLTVADGALIVRAEELAAQLNEDPAPESRHAEALAQFLSGHPRRAMESLDRSAAGVADPNVWSDLAAARYVISFQEDDPSELADALAAADAALHLAPQLPEARFNRALILEQFGLRDQARNAWESYLRVDNGSSWAAEAHQHIRQLQENPPFKDELTRNYNLLASDPAAAHRFARQYREDARRWGETEILGRWAAAEKPGDHIAASMHLAVARELGAELARDRGDHMLQALVAAIDHATPSERADLAEAHLAFRDGQKTYRERQPAKAETILLSAVEAFDRGHSPGALLARYFAANTAYSQGRVDEAQQKLETLLNKSPREFIAHRAQVLWQVSLNRMSAGRWGECIDAASESVSLFERLDEKVQSANVRQILAFAYQRIGDPERAWQFDMMTLRDLGQRPSTRLQTLLQHLAHTEATNRRWADAVSFFDLAVDMGHRVKDPLIQIETLTERAMARVLMGDRTAADADVSQVRASLASVREPAFHRLLEANIKEVEGLLATSAPKAVELLTEVIAFHSTEGRRMFLPELYLKRGRAYETMGDRGRSAADFEKGVTELESRRQTLAPGEERWGVFYDSDDLFNAAINHSLADGDNNRAFSYAERARARSLLDSLGASSPGVVPSEIPDGTVIVEYAVQPQNLVIFTVERHGVHTVTQAVNSETLAAEVAHFVRSAQGPNLAAFRNASRSVYRRFVEPIEGDLASAEKVVFVPDPKTGPIPFAALRDGSGRYLVEKQQVAIAPSAAVYVQLTKRARQHPAGRLLLVTGADEHEPLAGTDREATAVEGLYAHVTRLGRETATRDAFMRAAPDADVIHFAGHGVASDQIRRFGFLHLAGGDLDVRQIGAMQLRRTSLVVLAACDTAAGRIRATEGTISVARAFVAAGVPSVVATLWPIDDERAAAFFPAIHRYVARGLTPVEALRAAQIDAIHAPESNAVWAAVQVIGN